MPPKPANNVIPAKPPVTVVPYPPDVPSDMPRRFKFRSLGAIGGRPKGSWLFGCYFPSSNTYAMSTGQTGSGLPVFKGVDIVWVDVTMVTA